MAELAGASAQSFGKRKFTTSAAESCGNSDGLGPERVLRPRAKPASPTMPKAPRPAATAMLFRLNSAATSPLTPNSTPILFSQSELNYDLVGVGAGGLCLRLVSPLYSIVLSTSFSQKPGPVRMRSDLRPLYPLGLRFLGSGASRQRRPVSAAE